MTTPTASESETDPDLTANADAEQVELWGFSNERWIVTDEIRWELLAVWRADAGVVRGEWEAAEADGVTAEELLVLYDGPNIVAHRPETAPGDAATEEIADAFGGFIDVEELPWNAPLDESAADESG